MRIYWLEWKKLITSIAAWGFAGVCLLFNLLIISHSDDEYADYVSSVARDTGYILEPSFYANLSRITASGEQATYLSRLQYETDGVADVFEGYETQSIGERYIAAAGSTGYWAQMMRDKYTALQKVVDDKARNDESLTLYFAGSTHFRHQFLFNTLLGWLLIEGVLMTVLLVLLSIGYENIHGTESVVYSTKKGRLILVPKFAASVSAGLAAFALLALLTLLIYFVMNDYGGVWRSSVSSLFNYRSDLITGTRPVLTWYSFNVLTYLLAMLVIGVGAMLCFSLIALGIGMLVRNSYIAFLLILIANALCIVVPAQIPQDLPVGLAVRYLAVLSPIGLWLKHDLWFTDGDIDTVWPHFEIVGLGVSFVVLTVFCLLAAKYFRRKDCA